VLVLVREERQQEAMLLPGSPALGGDMWELEAKLEEEERLQRDMVEWAVLGLEEQDGHEGRAREEV